MLRKVNLTVALSEAVPHPLGDPHPPAAAEAVLVIEHQAGPRSTRRMSVRRQTWAATLPPGEDRRETFGREPIRRHAGERRPGADPPPRMPPNGSVGRRGDTRPVLLAGAAVPHAGRAKPSEFTVGN